ncbi:rRNA maturation RNase [Campylobacter sp. RM5004]|uniref:rRNA maturation RNase YbeY n=1 Tax=Campylobacter sp. RM5004 TaxID=1660078 RepID=UPI001EFBDB96|nr:rRNA maturation RNase YbeY [Campylobacter sp. RM5004]ULO01011.1 rRNA maturation RNase [Campylobacter sp. RM5004]
MILYDNLEEITYLEKLANRLSSKDIELVLTNNDEMQEINNNTRNIDKTTDVLSFPHDNTFLDTNFLGSLVINMQLAQEKANELGHSLEDEVSLLFIHGMLHLLGYDHEVDNGEMRELEIKLINEFNLPTSLIVRTLD